MKPSQPKTIFRPTGWWLILWLLVILFPCGGATCARHRPSSEFAPPVVFEQKPTLDNWSSISIARRTSNVCNRAQSYSPVGAPVELKGDLSWHRAFDFRLKAYPAGSLILGDALDAGSNADKFWMLTKLPGEPATLYFATHQQFEMQAGPRRILPISPLWIREALGVIEFEPGWHHEGPIERTADGNVEIRSLIPTHRGTYKRIAIIETKYATLRQLILKDPNDRMVATANQSEHQLYNAINATLPHKVDMELIPDNGQVMAFTIKIGNYLINQVTGNEALRYAMPESTGFYGHRPGTSERHVGFASGSAHRCSPCSRLRCPLTLPAGPIRCSSIAKHAALPFA